MRQSFSPSLKYARSRRVFITTFWVLCGILCASICYYRYFVVHTCALTSLYVYYIRFESALIRISSLHAHLKNKSTKGGPPSLQVVIKLGINCVSTHCELNVATPEPINTNARATSPTGCCSLMGYAYIV